MLSRARRLLRLKDGMEAVGDVIALGPAVIPVLEQLLRGPPESIFEPRCLVADTLGMIGGVRAVEALLRALEDSLHRDLDPVLEYAELAVINRIAENLGKLKDARSRQPLLQIMRQHAYPGVIRGLTELGEAEAIPWIVRALSDDYARDACSEALRKFGSRAVPALTAFLHEKSSVASQRGRAAAAGLLAELGARNAVEPLRRALDDPSSMVRLGAAVALSSFPERKEAGKAVPVLLEFLADEDLRQAEETMSALLNLRTFSEAALIHLIQIEARDNSESRKVHRAVELLEKMASRAALEAISRLHASPDEHLRFRALRALIRIPRPDVVPLIAKFTRDPDPVLQKLVVEGLRQRGVQGAHELVRALPRAGISLKRRIFAALFSMGPDAALAMKISGATAKNRAQSITNRWVARRLKRIRTRRCGKATR